LLGAAVLAGTLRAVCDHPEGEESWLRLFAYPATLARPSRGGVRRNLTSSVLARMKVHDKGGVLAMEGDGKGKQGAGRVRVERDGEGGTGRLCSDEGGVAPDAASASQLLGKHPAAPADRRPPPAVTAQPLQVTGTQVYQGMRSFAPGSAGGPDGLRPQHLMDLLGGGEEGDLLLQLTRFVNLVLAGGVPNLLREHFFGGRLFTLAKPGGGLRPIAVGMTLRRLVAKVANKSAVER